MKSEVVLTIDENSQTKYFEGQMYRSITNEQGQAISEYMSNYKGKYTLYGNNCEHVAQQGLAQAGIDFLDTKGSDTDEKIKLILAYIAPIVKLYFIVCMIINDILDDILDGTIAIGANIMAESMAEDDEN